MTEGQRARRTGIWRIAYAIVTVGCLGTAAFATYRIATLEGSATFIEGQLKSQSTDYEATLQTRYVDQEMQSFRERHQLLSESTGWWQLRLGLIIAWVLASFAFYIHGVISGFSEEIVEATRPV